MWAAVSGSASAKNSRLGVSRMPICLPTAARSLPLADSSAAAVSARSSSPPKTV